MLECFLKIKVIHLILLKSKSQNVSYNARLPMCLLLFSVCVCVLQNHPEGIATKYVYLISIQNSFLPNIQKKRCYGFTK